MQYDFKIRAEISHVKLISKALDILKSIAKGEITRATSLFSENKFADQNEKLDVKIKEINDVFLFIQKMCLYHHLIRHNFQDHLIKHNNFQNHYLILAFF